MPSLGEVEIDTVVDVSAVRDPGLLTTMSNEDNVPEAGAVKVNGTDSLIHYV